MEFVFRKDSSCFNKDSREELTLPDPTATQAVERERPAVQESGTDAQR